MRRFGGIFPVAMFFIITLLVVVLNNAPVFQGQQSIDLASLTGEYDQNDTRGTFHDHTIASLPVKQTKLAQVLGSSDLPKRIEVNLSNQTLYAYEGNTKVFEFLISSGKWYPTPTGTFRIWGKYRYTKMSGGSKAAHTYYYLPNVPFVMYFGNDKIAASRGFGLHGTYWHSNFGHPMSHGCINMKTEEAEQLFYWTGPNLGDKKSGKADADNPGTEITIYGEAPKE